MVGQFWNDSVNIKIFNKMATDTTSIHWHGLLQRDGSFWMDGVSYITQFPIPPSSHFVYEFNVFETGTQWYHSHSGPQYVDGLFGGFIIHNPDDGYAALSEFVITMNEWFHQSAYQITADLENNLYPTYFPNWTSGMFNNNGRYNCTADGCKFGCQMYHDLSTFHVEPGDTYRLRIIGSTSGSTRL